MNLWSVEDFFNISVLSNVLITEESSFDEKNVEEMFNWSEFHSEKKYYL